MSDMNYDKDSKEYPTSPEPFMGGDISGRRDLPDELRENLGSRRVPKLSNVRFPDADTVVAKFTEEYRQAELAEILERNDCGKARVLIDGGDLKRLKSLAGMRVDR